MNKVFLILGIFCLAVIFSVGFIIYSRIKVINKNIEKLSGNFVELKKISDTLVRGSAEWGNVNSKLKEVFSNNDADKIIREIKNIKAELITSGELVGNIEKKRVGPEKSSRVGTKNEVNTNDGKIIDVYEYSKRIQIKELIDFNKAPLGEVQFNAASEKPWSYSIYKRDYQLSTAVGKNEDGLLIFYHSLRYSIPSKDSKKKYKISLTGSSYVQIPAKNRMFWSNPILDFDFFTKVGIYDTSNFGMGCGIGISIFSYGETKVNSLFRFLRFGIGYDIRKEIFNFSFTPIAFNLGKVLPLITNMYLSPQLFTSTDKDLSIGLGIGVQL